MAVIEGKLNGEGLRFAIIQARFNDFIGQHLLTGAINALKQHNVSPENIDTIFVPGSWELPLAAQKLAQTKKYHGIIALGVLIRGETPHFEYISSAMSSGLAAVSRENGVPVAFGVLTVDTMDQAIDRAGVKLGNKGAESALAALEMASVVAQITAK